MHELLLGLLTSLWSTNHVLAASNVVARTTGLTVPVVNPADPVEQEYQRLLAADDEAQAEVDAWIQEADTKPGSPAALTLRARILQRFEPVLAGYEDFLRRQPGHTRARLAYASLLGDLGRYDESVAQMERARERDPTNPVPWNNLADHFSHFGPADQCIRYFARAVELAPREPLYRINLATAVAVFRADAREIYQLPDDQAVLRKALELYRDARKLRPSDFKLATDLAQIYYLLEVPPATNAASRAQAEALMQEAFAAWDEAAALARDDLDREGVALHKARLAGMYGRFDLARRCLESVKHPGLADLKARVARGLDHKEKAAAEASGP